MEAWQRVFRMGVVPLMSTRALEALRKACAENDSRLLQKQTTHPPAVPVVMDWECEGGCPVTFCGIEELGGFGDVTVGEADTFFARVSFEIDQIMGEPAACRHFYGWVDDTPREQMLRELQAEVELALTYRSHASELVGRIAEKIAVEGRTENRSPDGEDK